MTPILELRGLAAGYAGRAVISDIDMDVFPGEIVALVGANGAGKSTLAKTVSGLNPVLDGTIRFRGDEIGGLSPADRVRAGIAQVPEGRQIFTSLSVAQNLELGAYARKRDADDAPLLETIYARFPVLRERVDAVAGNLSGGQQQMLAIARGLMARPRLLILDEPSLGLSPAFVKEIFHLIVSLRDQGLSILLSEQNARQSLAIADRGYVIENGRLAVTGRARDLLASSEIADRYLGLGEAGKSGQFEHELQAQLFRAIRSGPSG
jgi:branched-chain amino acid transport system ATP-binding protein